MNDEPRLSGTVQIALRIPPELRERVKKAAEANNRSVNSELVATLEEKYPPPPPESIDGLISSVLASIPRTVSPSEFAEWEKNSNAALARTGWSVTIGEKEGKPIARLSFSLNSPT